MRKKEDILNKKISTIKEADTHEKVLSRKGKQTYHISSVKNKLRLEIFNCVFVVVVLHIPR